MAFAYGCLCGLCVSMLSGGVGGDCVVEVLMCKL